MRVVAVSCLVVVACNGLAGLERLEFSSTASGGAGGGVGGGAASGGDIADGGGGAGGDPTQISFTDDALEGEFDEGVWDGVRWDTDHMTLTPGVSSGALDSRVFDSGASDAEWVSLSYDAPMPYGTPLPDDKAIETFTRGADMSNNLLLIHYDDGGPFSNLQLIADASGSGNSMTVNTVNDVPLVVGRVGTAMQDDEESHLRRSVGPGDDLEVGGQDYTWMTWAKFAAGYDCSNNRTLIGMEDPTGTGVHMWLGCRQPGAGCPSGGPFPGGTWESNDEVNDGVRFCGSSTINDGAWHHIAAVREGYPTGQARLYFDGVLEDIETVVWDQPIAFNTTFDLNIGTWNDSIRTEATIDETAIFARALTEGEIAAVHARGAADLSFQVRACQEPTCDGVPFVGPDGTGNSVYRQPAGALAPNAPIPLATGVVGRYLQYRAVLSTIGPRPELSAVTVTADL